MSASTEIQNAVSHFSMASKRIINDSGVDEKTKAVLLDLSGEVKKLGKAIQKAVTHP